MGACNEVYDYIWPCISVRREGISLKGVVMCDRDLGGRGDSRRKASLKRYTLSLFM